MKRICISLCVATMAFLTNQSVFSETPSQASAEKKAFIQKMVTQYGFQAKALTRLFSNIQPNEAILQSMRKPFETKPWDFYRSYFVTPERIAEGATYLKTHHHELMALQKEYGIPASIITAIIGVETNYGQHLGKYSVLDSLYTLSFYYPPRAAFFQKELSQYLVLTRDNHLPVTELKGSYAGAMGIPQFMPSSYRHFGVSSNHNGQVDLFKNDDAIASVANYFYKNGWKPNQPIAYQLKSETSTLPKNTKRTTLVLKHQDQYWATYHNFNVIMSYNHNIVYAMVVYQLSEAITKQYETNRNA